MSLTHLCSIVYYYVLLRFYHCILRIGVLIYSAPQLQECFINLLIYLQGRSNSVNERSILLWTVLKEKFPRKSRCRIRLLHHYMPRSDVDYSSDTPLIIIPLKTTPDLYHLVHVPIQDEVLIHIQCLKYLHT